MELSCISGNNFLSSKKEKNPLLKIFLYFEEIELYNTNKLNTLNKTHLGETACLSNH